MLTIASLLLRDQIAEGSEPSANFLLLKLLPAAPIDVASMPLNLAIVIDNSTSMHIWRQPIREAIAAACQAVDLLGPNDSISVVAFQDEARVFQPQALVRDKEAIKRAIRSIQDWDSGGTRIAAGVQAALGQILATVAQGGASSSLGRTTAAEGGASRLLLLTDGHAEDGPDCLALAREAASRGVVFTTIGLGEQWNQHLLAEMAGLARGRWQYVRQASELSELFRREVAAVKETYIRDLTLRLKLRQGVSISKLRQVEPEVADITAERDGAHELVVKLFTMQRQVPLCLLAALQLSPRVAGRYLLAEIDATYRLHGSEREQREQVRVELQVCPAQAADEAGQNGIVLRYVDVEQIDNDYRQAAVLLEQGAPDEAAQLLMRAHEAAVRTGDDQRAHLIQATLAELQRTGQVSAGTRLTGLEELRATNLLTDSGGA
ncbi:MAG: von Willebrand factor type [Firmicutes bacterium]|nr:von Willebrand factor type [Bacillota bacterium]